MPSFNLTLNAFVNTENPYPRRPFLARGSKISRCPDCQLSPRTCICEFAMTLQAQAQFCLLTHRKEFNKPTNTGRLITQLFAGSYAIEWQRQEAPAQLKLLLSNPTLYPVIVFPPGDDYQQRMVTEAAIPADKTPLFILLDGTWRQARRMFRHSQYLAGLPVISLNRSITSRYKLRKKIEPDQLCTAEVAVAMLDQIDDQASAQTLDAYFDVFNDHYRAARMNRPLEPDQPAKQLLRSIKLSSENATVSGVG